ncbi:MAG: AAA family ATPase [Ardenticatenaceae bacterium]
MLRLERIQVKGFKSIESLDVDLQSLNVLIGANGAGKSNFLDLFRLLSHIFRQKLQLFVGLAGGAERLLHFGRKVTERMQIELKFSSCTYQCELVPASGDQLIFAHEAISYHDSNGSVPAYVDLGGGHSESKLNLARPQEAHLDSWPKWAKRLVHTVGSWRVYHFHDTSDSAKVKVTGDIDDNRFLRPDGSNLAAILYLLQQTQPAYYQDIVGTIRLVAPFFDDFVLQPSLLNPNKIKLEWRQKGSESYFDAYTLSDGTLRFITLATLLLQPVIQSSFLQSINSTKDLPIILLDEPELGLHPYAIGLLADLLSEAATRTQVVVSTQSVTLVEQFAPEDIIVVEHTEGQSCFKRLVADHMALWLEEYSLGELWEKNILGGRPLS